MRDEIKVVWNGHPFVYADGKEAVQHSFLMMTRKMGHQSSAAIKENLLTLCNVFVEMFTYKRDHYADDDLRKPICERLLRKLNRFSKSVIKAPRLEGEAAVASTYDFLLGLDDMRMLRGFGFVGNKFGNSEKESTTGRRVFEDYRNQLLTQNKSSLLDEVIL
jgi:hypothetical protein